MRKRKKKRRRFYLYPESTTNCEIYSLEIPLLLDFNPWSTQQGHVRTNNLRKQFPIAACTRPICRVSSNDTQMRVSRSDRERHRFRCKSTKNSKIQACAITRACTHTKRFVLVSSFLARMFHPSPEARISTMVCTAESKQSALAS